MNGFSNSGFWFPVVELKKSLKSISHIQVDERDQAQIDVQLGDDDEKKDAQSDRAQQIRIATVGTFPRSATVSFVSSFLLLFIQTTIKVWVARW